MSLFAVFSGLWQGRGRLDSPVAESAARARRARDHLERKRSRERRRRERERRRTEQAPTRARIRMLLAPVLWLLAIASGALVSGPLLELLVLRSTPLEVVAVQGARTLAPETIVARAGVEPGRLLGSIDPAAVSAAVALEPWIESARALRLPSGTLVISVVEREAIARWRSLQSPDRIELIDRRGERFAGRLDSVRSLPLLQERGGGHAARPRIEAETLELLAALSGPHPLVAAAGSMTVHLPRGRTDPEDAPSGAEDGYVIQIGERGPRVLLGRRLLGQRVARLAALLESEEPEIASARWIDLRYADRAVLRTEPVSG